MEQVNPQEAGVRHDVQREHARHRPPSDRAGRTGGVADFLLFSRTLGSVGEVVFLRTFRRYARALNRYV